ncbi:hypothetical protein THICB1_30056 [Thiomonas arsenitoxydans]|uniref:Uncharacterized protein n=1 Tax=Thiomonas arsenitoxydans (strain DSM 22701 / CIP 110005 / 3As) TaxID=426114 RepID=A0ABP1Z5E0_THIA3|nr:hypothetical protein THICB2_690058 [Thiomonas sp. CB2]CQR33166.1 hypothetical protein THICB1_30056 [Thiomonas arsenitoxydans]CQR42097.1 hypothetical protein THICB3120093 [Thiomonas sp. CB3]VDY03421.1 protein of unknown function [Thiomonas sp. Bio17B3]VDY09403.1 protein of unknown function [Thiomonas sp. Sup16B3]VDY11670.1 conserved protein of unknown function [Thiomonas sp. OC7]
MSGSTPGWVEPGGTLSNCSTSDTVILLIGFRAQGFELLAIEHLNLLLHRLQFAAAELQQQIATLVGRQRVVEAELPSFHGLHDLLQLGQRLFVAGWGLIGMAGSFGGGHLVAKGREVPILGAASRLGVKHGLYNRPLH